MHQVHAVAEFRYFGDEPRGLRLVYTAEHQEGSCSKEHTVDGTESPSDFYNRSGQIFSGYRLDIKRVDIQVEIRNSPMKKRSSLAVAFFSQGDMTGMNK